MRKVTMAELPVTEEMAVRSAARAALGCVVDAALHGRRVTRAALDSEIWNRVPKLFGRIKKHADYKAAMWWSI